MYRHRYFNKKALVCGVVGLTVSYGIWKIFNSYKLRLESSKPKPKKSLSVPKPSALSVPIPPSAPTLPDTAIPPSAPTLSDAPKAPTLLRADSPKYPVGPKRPKSSNKKPLSLLDHLKKKKKVLKAASTREKKVKLEMSKKIPLPKCPITPRFDFREVSQAAEGLKYLEENGYVVCSNVMTTEQIEKAKDLFWGFIKGLPQRLQGVYTEENVRKWPKRDDVKTWDHQNWPGDWNNGLIGDHGIGQSAFVWFVRSMPLIKKIFSQIWETSDLLVSFDGCGAFRPWRFNSKWKTNGGWYHVDQNVNGKIGKHCVQGLVSLYDGGVNTGGLTVIDGTKEKFQEIGKRIGPEGTFDFVMIPHEDPVLQKPGRLVSCKAGDLLLWDSRTIHCNSPGDYCQVEKGTKEDEQKLQEKLDDGRWDLLRLVTYVCMTPRSKASPEVLAQRKIAVQKNATTNHWPHQYVADDGSPDFVIPNTPYLQHDLI